MIELLDNKLYYYLNTSVEGKILEYKLMCKNPFMMISCVRDAYEHDLDYYNIEINVRRGDDRTDKLVGDNYIIDEYDVLHNTKYLNEVDMINFIDDIMYNSEYISINWEPEFKDMDKFKEYADKYK